MHIACLSVCLHVYVPVCWRAWYLSPKGREESAETERERGRPGPSTHACLCCDRVYGGVDTAAAERSMRVVLRHSECVLTARVFFCLAGERSGLGWQ
mmetsp:Transcript_29024/g.72376  ORF Transcript_29024/g.72376 Transcript_29024/m.72376 type:complete len:97 (-) Transcript_29024:729-1019(-)